MKKTPLSNSFTLVALLGSIISGILTYYEEISFTWGFTLTFTFLIFLIASFVSITPSSNE